jgi:hypothetical protein
MKDIFVIRGTLTFFGSLVGDVDTIGSLWGTLVIIYEGYVYFSFKKKIYKK